MALRNAGMRERHWQQLSELMEKEVNPDQKDFTLQAFLDAGMLGKCEKVEIIGDKAGKEFSQEKQLEKMKGEWETGPGVRRPGRPRGSNNHPKPSANHLHQFGRQEQEPFSQAQEPFSQAQPSPKPNHIHQDGRL